MEDEVGSMSPSAMILLAISSTRLLLLRESAVFFHWCFLSSSLGMKEVYIIHVHICIYGEIYIYIYICIYTHIYIERERARRERRERRANIRFKTKNVRNSVRLVSCLGGRLSDKVDKVNTSHPLVIG